MAALEINLFGAPELTVRGRPGKARSAKTLALLAFLALEADRAHSRERLAALLWGGFTEGAARQSLRQALYSLSGLADGELTGWIDAGHESVRMLPHPEVAIDVQRFVALAGDPDAASWREAAALYRGPLLDVSTLDDCEEYEAWRAGTRERLHVLALQNLDRLVLDRVARADWDEARVHAERLRALDPAREATTRHVLRILHATGDAAGLEAEWSRLRAVLEREFGARPSAPTEQLYRTLSGDAPADWPGPHPSASAGPPDPAPLISAARAAERLYAFGNALELHERALAILRRTAAPPPAICDALLRVEAMFERLGRRSEQVAAIEEALAIARSQQDSDRLAAALLRKAGALAYLEDSAGAKRAAQQALDTYRTLSDRTGEAEALRELGFIHWRSQAYASALEVVREALEVHRAIGDVGGEATALHNLAEIHSGLGSPRQAMDWYDQAMKLHWAAGNREGEILTLFGYANALQRIGDASGARGKREAALALSERYRERTMQARALHALAMQYRTEGELDAAVRYLRQTIDVDRSINYAHALGHDLADLSDVHALRGERAEALAALKEALVWFAFVEDRAALESTGRRLADIEGGREIVPVGRPTDRGWVRSHLALSEGKVYCEFESPMAKGRPE